MTNAGGDRMKKDLVPVGNTAAADEQYALTPVHSVSSPRFRLSLSGSPTSSIPKHVAPTKSTFGSFQFSLACGIRPSSVL